MSRIKHLSVLLAGSAVGLGIATSGLADQFNISDGDLRSALDSYAQETGISVLYPEKAVEGVHTDGARGNLSVGGALSRILAGQALFRNVIRTARLWSYEKCPPKMTRFPYKWPLNQTRWPRVGPSKR